MNPTPKFFEVTCISPDEAMDDVRGKRKKTLLNAHHVISVQEYFHPKDRAISTSVRLQQNGADSLLFFVEESYDTITDRLKQALV